MEYLVASVGLLYLVGFLFLGLILCRLARTRVTPVLVLILLALSFFFTWIIFRTELFLFLSLQVTVIIALACLFIYSAMLAFGFPAQKKNEEQGKSE